MLSKIYASFKRRVKEGTSENMLEERKKFYGTALDKKEESDLIGGIFINKYIAYI